METLADVSDELFKRYEEIKNSLKKGEKGDVFVSILKTLFYEYGEYFGFEPDELPEFKSEVIKAKNLHKKTKIKTEKFHDHNPPNEGSGERFTLWQVEAYGLNPESY